MMVALFTHLSRYYDDLFPLNEETLAFFLGLFKRRNVQHIADIACGTGKYTLAFAENGLRAVGIDLDTDMIAQAKSACRRRGLSGVRFDVADMRCFRHLLDRQDALICIGNSLANLTKPSDIRKTLAEFFHVLEPGGTLVIQLVNFDRYQQEGLSFPDITRDTPPLRLQRRYEEASNGLVIFHTTLSFSCPDAEEGVCSETDQTLLFPLTSVLMTSSLEEAGFQEIQILGDYHYGPFSPSSPASIYLCRKPILNP